MISCQTCGGRSTVYLCPQCIDQLNGLLDELPWLLMQLEVTRTRQDRLTIGAVGKGSNPSPINVGAMELAREAEDMLVHWVEVFCETGLRFLPPGGVPTGFVGPIQPWQHRLPKGYSGDARQRARWLRYHVPDIVKHKLAGDFYHAVADLCGDPDKPDSRPGKLIVAINRNDKVFAGLCPTVRGYDNNGRPVECQTPLWAIAETTVVCPRCEKEVDVAKNRVKTSVDRDLMTEGKLLEILTDLGEEVSRCKFYEWLKQGKVQVRGWLHSGQVMPHRIRRGDPRVFSLSQCRNLRWQEEEAKVKT